MSDIRQPDWRTVEPSDWGDKPLVILGAGPSVRKVDLSLLNDNSVRVLALKEMRRHAKMTEIYFGIDSAWLHKRRHELIADSKPVVCCFAPSSNPTYPVVDWVTYIQLKPMFKGLSLDPSFVHSAGCTGSAAFNYATLRGARDIILLGFDYKSLNPDNYVNHHYSDGDYPWFSQYNCRMWPRWASWFNDTVEDCRKLDVSVVNGSDMSLVTAFDIVDPNAWLRSRTKKEAA